MANTMMFFPETVEEFMEQNKVVDTEQIYTNGTELVPIFRMKQWFISHPCEQPRWIPVTERLPEEYGMYLVTVDLDYCVAVITLYYGRINRKDVFYDSDSVQWDEVIAWMPLPKPYKRDEWDGYQKEIR